MYLNEKGEWIGAWKRHPEDTPIIEKTHYWLFLDHATGEEFIVQLDVKYNFLEDDEPDVMAEMFEIAQKYFDDVEWLDKITEEEAEALGLDTYTE